MNIDIVAFVFCTGIIVYCYKVSSIKIIKNIINVDNSKIIITFHLGWILLIISIIMGYYNTEFILYYSIIGINLLIIYILNKILIKIFIK